MPQLDEAQRELLQDIVQLCEEDEPVLIHENTTQAQALWALQRNGLIETIPLSDPTNGDLAYEAQPTLAAYDYLREAA